MNEDLTADVLKTVLDATDITHVTQLILRERESRDLGRWERMRGCFWPDSLVRVSWYSGNGPGFVDGSIDMASRGILAKHRLGPILVNLNGNRAVATLAGIIDLPAQLQGLDFTLSSHARFLYRAEKRSGKWRLMGFDAIYMRDELTPSLPGQTITVNPDDVKNFRSSYRMLSYYLSSQGYEVNSDLAGEDRPDLVKALNNELYGWAGIGI